MKNGVYRERIYENDNIKQSHKVDQNKKNKLIFGKGRAKDEIYKLYRWRNGMFLISLQQYYSHQWREKFRLTIASFEYQCA